MNKSSIINKFETPGSIVNKLKYITDNNLNNKNDLEIIYFCLNDYKVNKKNNSLKIALNLLSNFFYKKMLLNFNSINNIYNIFKNKIIISVSYNSDINVIINFLRTRLK